MMPFSRQIGVGIFVIVGVLLFGGGLFLIGDRRQLFESSFVVGTEFANVSGLQNGANVRVSGLDAGEVLSIEVPPGPEANFRVTMRVVERVRPLVRSDSVATIQTDGLVGNKIVAISAGSSEATVVAENGMIASREPLELADLIERGSEAFDTMYESVLAVKGDFEETMRLTAEMARHADDLFEASSDELMAMASSGRRLAEHAEVITRRVREGQGTLGKLLEDDRLYDQTTEIAAEVRASLEEISATATQLRELSERSNEVMAQLFTEKGGPQGVLTDLRETLASTKDATADLAENMESLKRNWFFRGLFKDRGFYDLERMTVAEYRAGALRKRNSVVRRKWLPAEELFHSVDGGEEALSPDGREVLDRSMADFLRFPEDSPLVIEGYSGAERRDERYLESRRRARMIRDYLVEKFRLRPSYVGVMAMAEPSPEGFAPAEEGGVVMALFHDRDAEVRATDDAEAVPSPSPGGTN